MWKLLTPLSQDELLVELVWEEFGLGGLALLRVRSSMCFVARAALVELLAAAAVTVAVGMGRMRVERQQRLEVEESCIAARGLQTSPHIRWKRKLHLLQQLCTSHFGIGVEEEELAGIELVVEGFVEEGRLLGGHRLQPLERGIYRMRIVVERERQKFLVLVLSVDLDVACGGRRRCQLRLQRVALIRQSHLLLWVQLESAWMCWLQWERLSE